MDRFAFDTVLIGAGVVGLALARKLSNTGMSVLVMEKEERSGEGISSRNSGVIHAGMYYPENSLKAKFCVEGNKLLYDYCSNEGVSHERTGKLIISSNADEHKKLLELYKKGIKNGVHLELLSSSEVLNFEPEISCYSGILSPNTGVIDVPEYVNALEKDLIESGGIISHNLEFLNSKKKGNLFEIKVKTEESFLIQSRYLINCAGLYSDKVANNVEGFDNDFIKKIFFAKGHYFKYHGKNPFKKLIYPLPKPGSLGIHASWDSSKQLRFGPDLQWVDSISYEFAEDFKNKFSESIGQYWKNFEESRLEPDYSGIRPKLHKEGQKQGDFYISSPKNHSVGGFYNLQGIESPGLTSSLAIAEYIYQLIARNI